MVSGIRIFPLTSYDRHRIFNIQLRNIKGGFDHFMEVYPDNGDLDFFEILKVLKEVDYPCMVMPDHVRHHPDPGSSQQAFAFAHGYIRAMIQVVATV